MILITGGKGFIGSYLYEFIKANNEEVVVLDNLLNPSFRSKNINYIKIDLAKEIPSIDVSLIFHLAADISVINSLKNPKLCYSNNILSTLNILELARKKDAKIVFSSSAAVYKASDEAINEDWIKEPKSIYGLSKLNGEQLIELYGDLYGIKYNILRYSNVYGYGASAGVIPIFINKMMNGEDIEIYGDPVRDFIYVEDVVLFTYIAKHYEGIYNLSTGKGTKIIDLFNILSKKLNYQKKPIIKNYRQGEIKTSILNNSKLLNTFKEQYKYGWKRFVEIEEGLDKILKFLNVSNLKK